jgi:UDP-N-acetylglucosamine 1-carboxyvinyltransferase
VTRIKVYGGQKLNGTIPISGAKNSVLPLAVASILSPEGLKLNNVPPLVDVNTMLDLLESLGAEYDRKSESPYADVVELRTRSVKNPKASYEIVKKMRASILVLGPLLARFGECEVSLPGGCAIGVRPVDLHLKGLEALGAKIELRDGYIRAVAPKGLKGTEFRFATPTVTGTENIMMAAALADGVTVLRNVAREPEIVDLANGLNKMGAKISGQGTDVIVAEGVTSLRAAEHRVLPDRIEAGTYAAAAGITGGRVDLAGENLPELLSSFREKMEEAGLKFTPFKDGLRVEGSGEIAPLKVDTAPYPGFPTDLQAQTMALLCYAKGRSVITENIWENRFMHAAELMRMGADIAVSGARACINGGKQLRGASVMATDLRASVSLVLAALAAEGDTLVDRVYHLDRGYCRLEEKLAACGVTVERVK